MNNSLGAEFKSAPKELFGTFILFRSLGIYSQATELLLFPPICIISPTALQQLISGYALD